MRARAIILASALALAGCSGDGLPMANQTGTGTATTVQGGTVKIAPPRGYCLDKTATRTSDDGDFLLFGTCKALGALGPKAAFPAVLTAAIAPGAGTLDPAQMEALAAFLRSDNGRRALSRTDSGENVQVTELQRTTDLILVSARDGASGDLAPNYWRGIFTISGSLVTVTVSGTRAAPLPEADGRALIIDFIAATRGANAETSTTTPQGGENEQTSEGKGLRAIFNRLL